MKALLQRVSRASVVVDGETTGAIGTGLLVFLGCAEGDGLAQMEKMVDRVASYRIFPDSEGRSNLDVRQAGGEVLVVSQFTLAADTRKGRRPSFDGALDPVAAKDLIHRFCARMRAESRLEVEEGVFGAFMKVEIHNEGPATYLLEVV